MPRLFLALELPPAVQQELATVQHRLARRVEGFRWTRPELIHLTLLFLGETPEERLEELGSIMRTAVAGVFPLPLALGRVGFFGPPPAPRIIWVDVQAPPMLGTVQRRLADGCAQHGLAIETRPFTPHLTIGRACQHRHGALPPRFAEQVVPAPAPFLTHELVLLESRLAPEGPTYHRRLAVRLAAPPSA